MPTKLSDFRVRTRGAWAIRTGFFLIALVTTSTSFLRQAKAAPQTPRDAPISLFKLPTFNTEGFRTSLLRGTEARYVNQHQIDLTEMNLTLFFGDGTERVDTVLTAPVASVLLNENKIKVRGEQSVHVVREDLDATGERWTYDHTDRRILIEKNVRVVFRSELKDILK